MFTSRVFRVIFFMGTEAETADSEAELKPEERPERGL